MSEDYQRVAKLDELKDGGMASVVVGERRIVLFRRGERIDALDDNCPHAGAPLSEGFCEGDLVVCSWHGWTFRIDDGESADGSGSCVTPHEVRVEDGDILVKLAG
ncbi:MAG: Rieske (2Fe-2S) protein [Acidobacteriota bacterium]